ncbi:hypothetical protein [Micromonospora radicis]|uniref:Uncharacterized protein n=1 Tax=Micromonospora radicis TaxID=1894971 RepID=A0A418MUS8_9ACTN|nr:hypothetical protein [Micromonospora radicis]RIV37995.1 hypothetical protein D2L64_13680 [Micromonospora radicis]
MAHGEAEHGCAQGEPSRSGPHDQPAGGKHHRRPTGLSHPVEPAATRMPERQEDDPAQRPRPVEPAPPRQCGTVPALPRQRGPEPADEQPEPAHSGCRSDLPGWAGAHRHGPVRPAHRNTRRERPPRRWC